LQLPAPHSSTNFKNANRMKRVSQTSIQELEAQVRPGSPTKRQRTTSDLNSQRSRHQTNPEVAESLIQRFKQPEHLMGPQICSMCERNISKSVKILCSECPASENGKNELVMCLECLRLGKTSVEYPDHKPNHDYYVYDNLEFPLLTNEWTAL